MHLMLVSFCRVPVQLIKFFWYRALSNPSHSTLERWITMYKQAAQVQTHLCMSSCNDTPLLTILCFVFVCSPSLDTYQVLVPVLDRMQ